MYLQPGYKISELIDKDVLRSLISSLNKLTGLPSALIEADGSIIYESGCSDICDQFHKVNPTCIKKCQDYTKAQMLRGEDKAENNLYSCDNGMMHIDVPVNIQGKHIAMLSTSQFLCDLPDMDFFKKQAIECGFNIESYLGAAARIPVVEKDTVVRIQQFLLDFADLLEELYEKTIKNLQSSQALKKSEAQFKGIFESSPDSIAVLDTNGDIMDCNQATLDMFLVSSRDKLIGQNFLNFIPDDEKELFTENLRRTLKRGTVKNVEYNFVLGSGRKVVVEVSISVVNSTQGEPESLVCQSKDITLRKQREAKIAYLSFHDKLTGLYNRAYFEEELKRMNAQRQLPVTIIMADINGLKMTNDELGHEMGDRLLCRLAKIMKNTCRKEDVVARIGGDEFGIILPRTDEKTARKICDRIMKKCVDFQSGLYKISISLGTSTRTTADSDMNKMIQYAEDSMVQNKLLSGDSVRSEAIQSLIKALYERNYETEEHAERMQETCVKLGKAVGLDDMQIDTLRILALLHDIGKMGIPDSILLKPDKLSEEEWDIMKRHPEIGFSIAVASQELAHIAQCILCHHERWDGYGYPRRLSGDNIPIEARILSIADTYDVMTNERPYKKPVSAQEAIKEIERCSSTQFDPMLVKAFIKLMREDEKQRKKNQAVENEM